MGETRRAVLIASGRYSDSSGLQNLRCPENDVKGLSEILQASQYGAFDETVVSINEPHYQVLLQLGDVFGRAQKNDLILVYFSGHGKQDLLGNLYLTTTNTLSRSLNVTAIPVEQLRQLISTSSAKKIILILDCCYSGAAGGAFLKGDVGTEFSRVARTEGKGTYILTASTQVQAAIEKEGDEYGLLTKHIIEGIRQGGAARDDGLVSMDSLYTYVSDQVRDEGPQQPMRWTLGAVGDELVIATGGSPTGKARRVRIKKLLAELEYAIPPEILAQAKDLLNESSDSLKASSEGFEGLFDLLLQKPPKVNSFVSKWRLEERLVLEGQRQQELAEWFAEAEDSSRKEDWQSAISFYEKVLEVDSDNAKAIESIYLAREQQSLKRLYDAGVTAYNSRHWDEAIRTFDQIIKRNRSYKDAGALRANAASAAAEEETKLLLASAREAFIAGNLESAKNRLNQLLATVPTNTEASRMLVEVKRLEEASSLYRDAQELIKHLHWTNALKVLNRLKALAPDYQDVNELIASVTQEIERQSSEKLFKDLQIDLDRGEWSTAKTKLLKLLESNPNFSVAREKLELVNQQLELANLYNQGLEQYKAQHLSRALNTLQQLQNRAPNYKDVRQLLATIKGKLDNQSRLAALLKDAEFAFDQRQFEKAIEHWQKALSLDRDRVDIRNRIEEAENKLKTSFVPPLRERVAEERAPRRILAMVSIVVVLSAGAYGFFYALRKPSDNPVPVKETITTTPASPLSTSIQKAQASLAILTGLDVNGNPVSKGIGFFVSENELVTNLTVIEGVAKCQITVPGRSSPFEVVTVSGVDRIRRLTTLKVEGATASPLAINPEAKFKEGDRADFLRVLDVNQEAALENLVVTAGKGDFLGVSGSTLSEDRGTPILNQDGQVAGVLVNTGNPDNSVAIVPASHIKNLLDRKRDTMTLSSAGARDVVLDLRKENARITGEGGDELSGMPATISEAVKRAAFPDSDLRSESTISSSAKGSFTGSGSVETAYLVDSHSGSHAESWGPKKIVIMDGETVKRVVDAKAFHTILNAADFNNDGIHELLLIEGYTGMGEDMANVSLALIGSKSVRVLAKFNGYQSSCNTGSKNSSYTASAIYSSPISQGNWPEFRVDTYRSPCSSGNFSYISSLNVAVKN